MNIDQLLSIIKARKWVILVVFSITVLTTTIISLIIPKTYTASTSLVVDFKGSDPFGANNLPVQLSSTYMATQVDILKSHRVALKVVDMLKLDKNQTAITEFIDDTDGAGDIRDWLGEVISKRLDVIPSRDSRIIRLEYSSPEPRFAKIIANAFAQAYVDINLELSLDPAKRGTAWFEEQLKVLRTNVEEAQTRLTQYQSEHGIVTIDERIDSETAKLNALTKELVAAEAAAVDANSRLMQANRLRTSGNKELESIPEVISNAFIQNLKSEILKQQAKLDELSKKVGENHPQYKSAVTEIQSLRKKYKSEIRNIADGINNAARLAREREERTLEALAEQKRKVMSIKEGRDELNVLSRELETAQRVYDAALQRSNQINMESQFNLTNISVLTEATQPLEPSRPKVLLNILLAVFMGGLLGLGAAFLLEMLDRRIRSVKDLEEALGIKLLGVVLDDREISQREKKRFSLKDLRKNQPKPA
ncbi:MAG: chain length determinant protein EpsF [Gammaproteobacteria bacterium]|nr:chain length determinant protein EpsF [Gammaproteobacteria bacterium]